MQLDFLKPALSILMTLMSFGPIDGAGRDSEKTVQPLPQAREHVSAGQIVQGRELCVPGFVVSVPSGHYAGISAPLNSLDKARRSAIHDVARQILGTIRSEYDHLYLDTVSGDARNPKRRISDKLSQTAAGVVLGVEQNIVKSSWSRDSTGGYVYFILVRYPDDLVAEMRRLSKGSKVLAKVLEQKAGELVLKVTEVNGVEAVISFAEITIRKKNRFAQKISYYVVHVPEGSEKRVTMSINPVRVCSGFSNVMVPVPGMEKSFYDYLLGARVDCQVVLKGHDEIGRAVEAKASF